nr:hypothetical protein [Acinetobacter sp. ACNIH1]
MNIYFKQLLEWMNQNASIEEQVLIQALFLLRVHYSLAGIVVICQRIFTLVGDDELPEFRDELNTLKIISTLQGEFKHEVRQFEKSYDNQQAEQISLMV